MDIIKRNSMQCPDGSLRYGDDLRRMKIADLFESAYGVVPEIQMLASAGSDRIYYRLHGEGVMPLVATFNDNVEENSSFIRLSKSFERLGLPVPSVKDVGENGEVYLQEDLGDISLLQCLSGDKRLEYSENALRKLVDIQVVDEAEWIDVVMNGAFSVRQIMWDLNYFKYEFLKPCGFIFNEDRLEDDFVALSTCLMSVPQQLWGFMYRDFQSRNIMIKDGSPFFIDFQGGRKGPLLYDAVSFLWQAKAGFTDKEREHLLGIYAAELSRVRGIRENDILSMVDMFALFRTLQVLGAYGFRGLIEKRAHFIESIPGAIENLKNLMEKGELDGYPEMKKIALQIVSSRFASVDKSDGLVVKVFSFSYKKGYPEDLSGNGGGFMFDCRGMHNPGRYDEYKLLTGLDAPVICFLEERGEVQKFVANTLELVSPSVERYMLRGFRSLQIGFGCTGGRHRSVYCAQKLAERLAEIFPDAKIELCHREQGIWRRFNF